MPKPEIDTSSRIVGPEFEAAIAMQDQASGKITQLSTNKLGLLLMHELEGVSGYNMAGFKSNGMRFYLDLGLAEIAGAEAPLEEIVLSEEASMRFLLEVTRGYLGQAAFDNTYIHKRVIDPEMPQIAEDDDDVTHLVPVTTGAHENYYSAITWDSFDEGEQKLKRHLAPHLSTRNIYCGGGVIEKDFKTGARRFALGQKALAITVAFNELTLPQKPLVNLRREPHAEEGSRIHVTCGDIHESPIATFMQYGTTSLSLRLTEEDRKVRHLPELSSRDLLHLNYLSATDLTFQQTVELSGGKRIRPLDVQDALLEAAGNLTHHSAFEKSILERWSNILTDLREDPNRLAFVADWATKLALFERYKKKHNLPNLTYADEALLNIDTQYSLLTGNGTGEMLRKKYGPWKELMPTEAEIQDRMMHPPETRAKVRGESIKVLGEKALAAWDGIAFDSKIEVDEYNRPIRKFVKLPDPADATMPKELEEALKEFV